ncbi:MAG TPA: hypothetical protein VGR07_14490 [Thermoanaerobaculia bacterium]|jgi:hypothetical protein|nr:hypothetical protein [Thermoanaerobaculia bacterium]
MSTNYAQSPQLPKKGMGPLGWIAIGCGVILVICVLVFAVGGYFAKKKFDQFSKNPAKTAAELIVRANPDLELVSEDEKAGTITVRDKKKNETATLNFDDIKNGKFKVTTDKGTTTFDGSTAEKGGGFKVTDEKGQTATIGGGSPQDLPSWLPVYPGATAQGSMASTTNEGRSGGFSVSTKDSIEQVASFYESKLKAAGLTVDKNMVSSNDKVSGGTISGNSEDKKRTAAVLLSVADPGTQAVITYEEKK